jgi:hypothetical protein
MHMKRRFGLHLQCPQEFSIRNKTYSFSRECGWRVIYKFFWKITSIEVEIKPRKYNSLLIKCS